MADDTLPTPAPDAPPVIAGRYELGPVIGRGGTADVHRARDLRLRREVAVKRFTGGVTGPDRHRQDTELTTLARLRHPGLIELFDAGNDDGRAYLVMQLVAGPPLSERLQAGPWPEQAVAGLGAELADTLGYVHSNGVTHRDVKPANVLLGEDDRPMLGDFGIARLVDTTRVTAAGYLVGTAAYMSPEQVRGAPVGPATDVYALGLVLLECVTGRREYPGALMESLTARLHRPPDVPPGLAHGLTPLLTRMTATDPTERPTAADVAAALRSPGGGTALIAAPPIGDATTRFDATTRLDAAPPAVAPGPAPPPVAWRRRVLPAIVGVLLVASGVAFLWSMLGSGADPAPAPPRPSQVAPVTPSESEEQAPEPEPEPTPTPEPESVPPPPPATRAPTSTPESTPPPTEAEPPTGTSSVPEPEPTSEPPAP